MHEQERPLVEAIRQGLIKELTAGNHVVLGYGLWPVAGGTPGGRPPRSGRSSNCHLPADRDERLRRLDARNPREDASAVTVAPSPYRLLRSLRTRADDEDTIVYHGDMKTLVTALHHARRG
ncbi:ATP-binding protein [Streptomyces albogriseolus]|uniref:ATP-binding protein n=1 Tax=Streptomyces albogriseolus TaxID=1887 RepID=UPI0036862748